MEISWKTEIAGPAKPTADEVVGILLKNRNIKDPAGFLHPESPHTIDLAQLGFARQFKKTVILLETAKKDNRKIVVYTDYDADGITGGTILWETLHMLGFDVMPYVPHRKHEGYGFSTKGIDRVKKEFDPYLIISVDHGISGKKEIAYAASLGIKVVVTDHHLAPKELPDEAEAVFHIPALSGSGVAYFFAKEIWNYFSAKGAAGPKAQKLPRYFDTDYLALAAIGTIADLVPLTGPSRSIVYHGLKAFPKVTRTGIREIIKQAKIENRTITPYEIGFIIAPRINAVGRLEHAIDALRLLCTQNETQAHELAAKVGATNKNRQDLVEEAVEQALVMAEAQKGKDGRPPLLLILQHPDWNEGIIGLIASKITEKYDRPTIVMTKSDGAWKGSARSLNEFHLTDFLRLFQPLMLSVGGHKLAAGFSVTDDNLKKLTRAMLAQAKKMVTEKDFIRRLEADIKLPLPAVTIALTRKMEMLAPYGIGNPYPTFVSDVIILDKKHLGKKSEHVKFFVKDALINSFPIECLAFYKAEAYAHIKKGETYMLVYQPEINVWNGRESLNAKVVYLSQSDQDLAALQKLSSK